MDLLRGFYCAALAGELFVSVAPGTDTLRAAIAALPATPTVVYHLLLSAGTYNEIQLTSKANISIEGAGIGQTIIVVDGTRTDVDPVSGQRYVDMAQETKHGILLNAPMTMSGLDWRVNDVKYAVHGDSSLVSSFWATACRFAHANGYPVGHGVYPGEAYHYVSCQFEKTGANVALGNTGSHGVFAHNAASQTAGWTLEVRDCTFTNTGTVLLSEFGSGQTDTVTVTRCITDDAGASKGIYITAASSALPYSIEITQNGGTMPAFDHNATTRPDADAHYTYVP